VKIRNSSVIAATLLIAASGPAVAADPPYGYGAPAQPGWASPNYGVPAWGGMPPAGQAGPVRSPYGAQPPAQPGYGAMPGAAPYAPYGQVQPPAIDASPPRVELQLNDHSPYVQQSVILTLRLVSAGSLPEATPELPSAGAVLIRPLDGPRTSVRQQGGKREVVNEFRFVATPLETGDLTVPGLRVRGDARSTCAASPCA